MCACMAFGGCTVLQANSLERLALGERAARTVGVNVSQLRFRIAIVTAVMVAVITTFCGGIRFRRTGGAALLFG